MHIISAVWEKRNLGRNVVEVHLGRGDTLHDFLEAESRLIEEGRNYLVVKIPVSHPEFLDGLPKANYKFIETSFALKLRKDDYKPPRSLILQEREIKARRLDTNEARKGLFEELGKGIFSNDRIALDPRFSIHQANLRYKNWIQDSIMSGAIIFEVYSKDSPVGFFMLEEINKKKIKGLLSGAYDRFRRTGFGSLLIKKLCEVVWEGGYDLYCSSVSSNNMDALRCNLAFGATIESAAYTFVKHLDSN